jgi:hypothetical protein
MTYQEANGTPGANPQTKQPQQNNHLPPAPPRLPEYKPKGMSRGDKVMAWLLAIAVLTVVLVFGGAWVYNNTTAFGQSPKVPAAVQGHKSKSSIPWVVVVNNNSGYVWWLNQNGSHFTKDQAKNFIEGHDSWHIYSLKIVKN